MSTREGAQSASSQLRYFIMVVSSMGREGRERVSKDEVTGHGKREQSQKGKEKDWAGGQGEKIRSSKVEQYSDATFSFCGVMVVVVVVVVSMAEVIVLMVVVGTMVVTMSVGVVIFASSFTVFTYTNG